MNKLLLLHGALGSAAQFDALKEKLRNDFEVFTLNFSGHGGTPIPNETFSIELFANDVIKWMDDNSTANIDIFGYSMGGYVALYLARHYRERIGRIFTLATKFDWSEESAAREVKMLDPEKIKQKVPEFADELIKRHGEDNWEMVLKKTTEMMINLGKNKALQDEDLQVIENEVQISVGEKDKMVSMEETINAYRQLKNGHLLVLANTPHPLESVDTVTLSKEIKRFFK